MKVLVISSGSNVDFFKEGSFVRTRMKEYAKLVDELHVIIFTPTGFKKEKVAENLFFYPTSSWTKFLYIFDGIQKGKEIIGKGDSDWIITTQDPFEAGLVGRVISRKFKLPLEIQVHTDIASLWFQSSHNINRVRIIIARFVLPFAQSVRTVSNRVKEGVSRMYNLRHERIRVLPIAITTTEKSYSLSSSTLSTLYPQFTHYILMVCRLEPEKDVGTAFLVFKSVLEKFPNAGLIVVGDGSQRQYLKQQAVSLRISDNVVFEGHKDDLEIYYQGADVLLSTSLYEGFGLVFIEASSAQCPIVSTNVGIMEDLLKDEESAFICSVRDVKCLAEKTCLLLENIEIRKELAQRAFNVTKKHLLNWSDYFKEVKEGWYSLC